MDHETAMDEETIVSRETAFREIAKHHSDPTEFVYEYGHCAEYRSKDVLEWLGY